MERERIKKATQKKEKENGTKEKEYGGQMRVKVIKYHKTDVLITYDILVTCKLIHNLEN